MKIHLLNPFGRNPGVAVGKASLQAPARDPNGPGAVVEAAGKVTPLVFGPFNTYLSALFALRIGVEGEEVER